MSCQASKWDRLACGSTKNDHEDQRYLSSPQADVDLTELRSDERLTSFRWTPNGTLLLGTNGGRLLAVQGAAPVGLPGQNWGPVGAPGVLSAVELLSPEGLREASPSVDAPGSVIVHIAVTQAHIILVCSGGQSCQTSC